MTKKTRIFEIEPAHDLSSSGGGRSSATLRMILKGDKGAVQFVAATGWLLKGMPAVSDLYPFGMDVGYHSPKPMYEGQSSFSPCPYLDGEPCYYDGSGLRSKEVLDLLIEKGSEAVWDFLEEEYDRRFLDEDR